MARFNPGTAATTAAIAATARKLNRPGAGGDLQSATGGGYRAPGQQPKPNAAELRARQRIGTPVPTQAAPALPPAPSPSGMQLPRALRQQVEAGTMSQGDAFNRAFQNRAGFRERAMQTIGQGPPPTMTAPADMDAAPGRMQDLVRSFPPGGPGGPPPGAPPSQYGQVFRNNGPVMPPLEFQTGGGLQAPGGAPNPANQPPGIEGAIANLRNQLGESQAGGSGADPMSMIARLRGNAQIAQANGYPIGGAGGGKGPASIPWEQMRSPQAVQNLQQVGLAGAPGTKPFFGDISQMPGAPSGPIGLSGLPVAGGAGPGGNPYLSLLRNRLGA